MNDNEVKNAFDHIEPEPGAQERMYANILKKQRHKKKIRMPKRISKKISKKSSLQFKNAEPSRCGGAGAA